MRPPMFSSLTARGITLVESSHKASSAQSRLLVNRLMIHCKQKAAQLGKPSLAFRIGLSGPPGAGKSTFTGDKSFQQSEDRFRIVKLVTVICRNLWEEADRGRAQGGGPGRGPEQRRHRRQHPGRQDEDARADQGHPGLHQTQPQQGPPGGRHKVGGHLCVTSG